MRGESAIFLKVHSPVITSLASFLGNKAPLHEVPKYETAHAKPKKSLKAGEDNESAKNELG